MSISAGEVFSYRKAHFALSHNNLLIKMHSELGSSTNCNTLTLCALSVKMVRMKGLEPSRLSALAPKASVSTIPPHPQNVVTEVLYEIISQNTSLGY